MRPTHSLFVACLSLGAKVWADPTWPASTDEIEEILYQLKGFRARLFSDTISPCSNEASGPGRQNAAEWLRVGFHDMSTANTFFGTGGLDASLQFELTNGENTGPGHNTTLQFLSNYLSTRASMADLIAAGVVASVRSCGGPVIPLRLGRVDATTSGSTGVPQPGNAAQIFVQQFDRMGFSVAEMIQVTACGHTLGGVHSTEFPELVPAGSGVNGEIALDSTDAVFDNKIVTEYLDNNTTNPLIREPSISQSKNSDFKVFSVDNNVTMQAMADTASFKSVCQTVLQKMIDTVPKGVTLTSTPLAPYLLKPVDMQLTLNTGGSTVLFTGYIRLRTTQIPIANVDHIVLTWKDRYGGSTCGSVGTCSTTSTFSGTSTGFDDSFTFFPISTNIDTATGISSFTVVLYLKDGTTQSFDNNGNGYPMSDAVILQKPQSCLLQGTGALTVTGLVRNDLASLPVNLNVTYLVPRNTRNGNPVPAIKTETLAMTTGNCVGQYTFFSASYVITGGLSYNARLDVTAGSYGDYFRVASSLAGTCLSYSGSATCSNVTTPTSTTTSSPASSTPPGSSTVASSATPSQTLGIKPQVGGYNFVSCWTEGSGTRALSGAAFAYDGMTLESCMANCTGFNYWGTEYGRECYCGNTLASSSSQAAAGDCSMVCSGNQFEYCGAGSRLELYSTTASVPPAPTGTLAVKPTVGKWFFQGCVTEGTGVRALSGPGTASDSMTLEVCASFCDGYKYFGTEYGRECYCGDTLAASSTTAALGDCSMTCAGNAFEYCGAGNRLELYGLAPSASSTTGAASSAPASSTPASSTPASSAPASSTLAVSTPASSATTTTSTAASTSSSVLAHKPTVSPYSLVGCWTEGNGVRALSSKSYASGTDMTLESCATFCSGYKYFGVEYAQECYCGNSLASSSTNASLADCSMPCTGNPFEYCGAGNRLELYSTDITVPAGPSQPATVSGGWKFVSCYTEGTGSRALTGASYADDAMTLESCAAYCTGYKYFGTEYGRECYCGSTLEGAAAQAPQTDCSFTCAGNSSEYCGAGSRLSLYTSAATVKKSAKLF
ncbi:heme peroxidase [Thozetella sp. PMI_491]|nr:heme peroxidase [Thozetella sp. PMI_491]